MDKIEFKFLRILYEKSGGQALKWYKVGEVGKELGINVATAKNITRSLNNQGYLKWKGLGGNMIALTPEGARELKKVL